VTRTRLLRDGGVCQNDVDQPAFRGQLCRACVSKRVDAAAPLVGAADAKPASSRSIRGDTLTMLPPCRRCSRVRRSGTPARAAIHSYDRTRSGEGVNVVPGQGARRGATFFTSLTQDISHKQDISRYPSFQGSLCDVGAGAAPAFQPVPAGIQTGSAVVQCRPFIWTD
jgi:hypothetical protein